MEWFFIVSRHSDTLYISNGKKIFHFNTVGAWSQLAWKNTFFIDWNLSVQVRSAPASLPSVDTPAKLVSLISGYISVSLYKRIQARPTLFLFELLPVIEVEWHASKKRTTAYRAVLYLSKSRCQIQFWLGTNKKAWIFLIVAIPVEQLLLHAPLLQR